MALTRMSYPVVHGTSNQMRIEGMRYVLHPGYVISKNDGQEHFIGGPRLARLYGVDMRQCVFGGEPGYQEQEGDVHLCPDYHGRYALPSNKD